MAQPRAAVFLDRDGTLIEDADFLTSVDEIRILPGTIPGLKRLHDAGFLLVVVSNQSGVARGYLTRQELERINNHLVEQIEMLGGHIDGVYCCPHHPEGTVKKFARPCTCRKPKPGLFLQARDELGIDLSRSFAVGDAWRDVEAAWTLGIPSVKLPRPPSREEKPRPDLPVLAEAGDLGQAADKILGTTAEAARTLLKRRQESLAAGRQQPLAFAAATTTADQEADEAEADEDQELADEQLVDQEAEEVEADDEQDELVDEEESEEYEDESEEEKESEDEEEEDEVEGDEEEEEEEEEEDEEELDETGEEEEADELDDTLAARVAEADDDADADPQLDASLEQSPLLARAAAAAEPEEEPFDEDALPDESDERIVAAIEEEALAGDEDEAEEGELADETEIESEDYDEEPTDETESEEYDEDLELPEDHTAAEQDTEEESMVRSAVAEPAEAEPQSGPAYECERCGVVIDVADLESGAAGDFQDALLCRECLPAVARMAGAHAAGGAAAAKRGVASAAPESTEETMQQLLVEMRRLVRRSHDDSFGLPRIMGYIAQLAALVIGAAAVLSGDVGRATVFMIAAVFVQLIALTMFVLATRDH